MYAVYCCDATLLEEAHEFVSSFRFRDHGVSIVFSPLSQNKLVLEEKSITSL